MAVDNTDGENAGVSGRLNKITTMSGLRDRHLFNT